MNNVFDHVWLTSAQIEQCLRRGHQWQSDGVALKRRPGNNAPTDWATSLTLNQRGVLGEFAASLFFPDLEWTGTRRGNIGGLADLGGFIDVKTVEYDTPLLVLQKDKIKNHWVYLLVNGINCPDFHLVGWLWGREAWPLEGRYYQERIPDRPAFFIPPKELHPLEDLVEMITCRRAA